MVRIVVIVMENDLRREQRSKSTQKAISQSIFEIDFRVGKQDFCHSTTSFSAANHDIFPTNG
ncbi:MAG: hypothetical protein ABI476_03265 [Oxalobacteraceae bacterium]